MKLMNETKEKSPFLSLILMGGMEPSEVDFLIKTETIILIKK